MIDDWFNIEMFNMTINRDYSIMQKGSTSVYVE